MTGISLSWSVMWWSWGNSVGVSLLGPRIRKFGRSNNAISHDDQPQFTGKDFYIQLKLPF